MTITKKSKIHRCLRVSGKKINAGDLAGGTMGHDWGGYLFSKLISPVVAAIPFHSGLLAGSPQGLSASIEGVLAAHHIEPVGDKSVVAAEVLIVFTSPFPIRGKMTRRSLTQRFQMRTATLQLIHRLFGPGVAAIVYHTDGPRLIFRTFVVPIERQASDQSLTLSAHDFFCRRNLIRWQAEFKSAVAAHSSIRG